MFALLLTKTYNIMKLTTLFIGLFLFVNLSYSQEKPSIYQPKKHSLSIGLTNFMDIYKLSYDYSINTNGSIGSSISYSPKKSLLFNNSSYNEFIFTLNYKHFLSNKKKQQGVYFGSTLSYLNATIDSDYYDSRVFFEDGKQKDLYLGLMVGYKYVHKNNFFIESNITFNERLFKINNQQMYTNPSRTDFSISIGKRF